MAAVKRLRLTDPALLRRYDLTLLAPFKTWVEDNSSCLQDSQYPSQVVATVSRFLFQSNAGRKFNMRQVIKTVFRPEKIETWLTRHETAGVSHSTLHNYVICLRRASDFAYARLGAEIPRGHNRFMRLKLRLLSRRRNAMVNRTMLLSEPSDLKTLKRNVLSSGRCTRRMYEVASACLSGQQLHTSDFLFAMRLALLHAMISVAARPSALYTLTMRQVRAATGAWTDLQPIIIRNPQHKTSASHGPARLVLSGSAKVIFHLFVSQVRATAVSQFSLPDEGLVFFNTVGNALNSSTLNKHIQDLQRDCLMTTRLTATKIRKSVTSLAPARVQEENEAGRADICEALCHTPQTSSKYYNLVRRDRLALRAHKTIMEYFDSL